MTLKFFQNHLPFEMSVNVRTWPILNSASFLLSHQVQDLTMHKEGLHTLKERFTMFQVGTISIDFIHKKLKVHPKSVGI